MRFSVLQKAVMLAGFIFLTTWSWIAKNGVVYKAVFSKLNTRFVLFSDNNASFKN